nr:hypothetical protein [Gammaproteobacteria bacterium]
MVRKGSKLQRIHAAQPSLADLVQAGDDDYLSEEGVDGDFKHVLGEINAFSKRNPETFIGSPKAISTSVADDTLRQYLLGIQSDNPEASFTALIPIAYEQYHWVLAIVTLEHGYFEDAVLYDALDGTHSGFDTFQGIMLDLGIDASKISTEFTGEQQDDFRCFDYVCRRMMIETDNSDHPIVTAETAELLRLQVCKTMGVRLNKPIKLEQDETKLIIDESDPDAAMLRALLTKLSKKHPELDPTRDIKFNLSGGLTVSQAKPVPTVSSEEDDVKLYLRDSKNEQQNAEEKFQTHFDDSSDEDDDGGELTEKDLFERARPLVKKYRKKKSKPANTADEDTISFMLYILGVMVLRSNGVKPYWHYLKNKHLKMTDAEYQAFKKSVIDAFAVQYEYDAQGRQCFEQQYWKTFLTSFRQHAKYSQDDREVILLKAVTDIVSVLSTKGSQNDIDIVANTVATKINLPNWSPAGKISVGFPDKQYANKKFQLLAITLLQHRITSRTWKAEEGGGTVTLEAGLHGVDCKIKVGLNRDVKSRTDELKQVGAYP